jgi:glucan 1,3-beta-glucosidase
MRPANIFVAALAAAPLAVSAGGTLGFALGATNPDQSSSCKSTSDYEADFATLKDHTKLVRVYSTSQCNQAQNILPAAKNAGFQVLLGVWLVHYSTDSQTNC